MRLRYPGTIWIALVLALSARPSAAQETPSAPKDAGTDIGTVSVVSSRADVLGIAGTASEGSVTKEELALRPVYRVGQLLETVPGLVVTTHAGEGKANQYFIRGFNLDHGTDFATYVDDMPVNQSTHTHGQGYSDVHFILPEMLSGLDYTKGPFYPEIGDFGALGSAHMQLADTIPTQVSVSAGTLGEQRVFLGGTEMLANGDRILGALAYGHLDGPWSHPDNYVSYNGALRYTHGDRSDGFDLTAMAYRGTGNFTTDQPVSAYQNRLITRFGSLDPSDGNITERQSLSGHVFKSGDDWQWVTSAYVIHSRLTLWNNYTHYLVDPVLGDQEEQNENRLTLGAQSVFQHDHSIAGFETENEIGIMARHDSEYIDRRHTQFRKVLADCPNSPFGGGAYTCNADRVSLDDVGIWISNTTHWTPWLRSVVGLREEYYAGHDRSLVTGFVGHASQSMLQPKGSLIIGPFADTELYISAGQGFHSNDLRGVLGTVPTLGVSNPNQTTPLMTKIVSEEIGLRSNAIPGTILTAALFREDFDSFLTYDADNGVDNSGPPARLEGVELSAQVHPTPWLELNADLNFTHSRYHVGNLDAYGLGGRFIPQSPNFIGSIGALVDNLGPWFGGVEMRWLGAYPLVDDNSLRSPGYKEVNLDVGYKFSEHAKLQLSVFNLFNTRAAASQYAYTYQVSPGAAPETGATYHPLEPLSARVTFTQTF